MKNVCLFIKITTKQITRKSQHNNSPYLSQVLNITFQYKPEFEFLFVPYKFIVAFPWIFEYGNSVILELGKMGAKSMTVCLIELLLVTVDWSELLLTKIGVNVLFS